ncbi:MAG: alkaline phosphatase family protein [Gemmataceae bacterium]
MALSRLRRRFIALSTLFVLVFGCARPAPPPHASPLKLIVLVVFDQMRADYLTRWQDQFGEGGFRKVCNQGTWFTNCNYPYACTVTGPGHASLATGCSPNRHGIIGNEWYERPIGKVVSCSSTNRQRPVRTVPRPPLKPDERGETQGASPERLLAPTFADALKESGAGKVVALSLKDRAACLPGGKNPDACYWFDTLTGSFATSTYYRDRCHDWVAVFNSKNPANRWFGQAWNRLRSDLDYVTLAGPDEVMAESPDFDRKLGRRSFPHSFVLKSNSPDREYYGQLCGTPFANDLLLDFAKTSIRAMGLGQGATTDFLSVSFSSNDSIGHTFGPDSQEVFDVTLRSDAIVADLIAFLDAQIGRDKYLLAISADHGVCPFPEISTAKGLDARRVSGKVMSDAIDDYMNQRFAKRGESLEWIENMNFPWVYLNERLLASRKLYIDIVAEDLSAHLRRQPWAGEVYPRSQLEHGRGPADRYLPTVRKSFHPGRSGDLFIVLKPFYLPASETTGTTHGSPYEYDTHVPLLFFGRDVQGGRFDEAVTPQAIAAVFAHAAGIAPPALLDASIPSAIQANARRD